MKLAVGNSRMDKKWKNKEITWPAFKDTVRTTKRTTETVSEFRKMTKARQDSIKDIGGFVGGALREGKRRNGYVICRSMLTLDMDYATPDTWAQLESLYDWACCLYSTHKHTPEAHRLRLVIPLARDVSEDEYPALGRMVAKEIGIDMFDDTTYEPSRLMYWPSTPSDGEFVFQEKDGSLLDPDTYLSKYADWRDTSMWPTSKRQSEVIQHSLKQQKDPLEKSGVIGAFCRAYSIEDAIAEFLPEVYEPSAMEGRFDYIPADSSAGVVVYGGKFAYSHHATDPVCGKLLNAFDLVRLHKYAELEEKASFKAMSEFAVKDARVKAQLTQERKLQLEEEFSEEEDWQGRLELEKNGKIKDTLSNISTILRYDPALQPIVFNQFKNLIDVISELPWPQVKPGWSDTDLACAKLYFERSYGIWSPTKFKDALLGVVSVERLYHPIKNYLSTLKWDGVERLDTLLIDYLGADDTPYVRAVTRKTLVAAVARIYRPGTKFDSILVLNGSQGIGKSTLFSRLGGPWYSDSLSISDMKDKTAPEKLQGYWILELGELAGIKKMDVETVKSFITRTDDKYRQSYGVSVESHPRSCIIVGTTNSDGGFLRDITGNRRFWPVRVMGHGKHYAWELSEVDQIWAEAIERYKAHEELFLKGALAEEAVTQQRDAMESDDREGLVAEYLEVMLPDGWDKLDLYQRRNHLNGGEFGEPLKAGSVKRNQVCVMEIWCECFCKARESIRKGDSYEIEGILNKIGGWRKFDGNKTGKKHVPLYGPQRVFVRLEDEV
ncbi:virulence-associated E family protein [Gudongella oleilytica]|uniref:virulence-associated E family protein n=1 Tax=Gudongella oleilytica TaxID=1582259 RepID=UPI000FF8A2BC|nr:virulence-associated E family protein [Gudongella oleilytica]